MMTNCTFTDKKININDQFFSGVEEEMNLPPELGEGYIKYSAMESNPSITMCDFHFNKTISIEEKQDKNDIFMLSFCMSDGFEWIIDNKKTFFINEKESCIQHGAAGKCSSLYYKNQYYKGIGIGFSAENLSSVVEALFSCGAVNCSIKNFDKLKKYTFTPHVEMILKQIIECNVSDGLRGIYLEGKILELIAVYLDEMILERGNKGKNISLSSADFECLSKAKEILDKTYVHPLTISQLSKMVFLNEYKLKTCFKQRYGQTIYSYVIDKRMKLARLLLEQGKFKVTDISGMVGYTNTSHFIEAFYKKYGITPGAYLKNGT